MRAGAEHVHAGEPDGRKVRLPIGSGELKQIQPYGHSGKEKLGRLEDFYKIFTLFRDNNETPIDFEGKFTTLDHAWLGVARNHIPRIWGLGGGPKIIDLATTYADGSRPWESWS